MMNKEVFDGITVNFESDPDLPHADAPQLKLQQTKKLQPDVVYYYKDMLYIAARGPKPVSAVKAQNVFENAHPGLMALKIDSSTCQPSKDQSDAFILTTLERSPEITSDVHALWGVMNGDTMEIWTLDQAATGSVKTYQVYSACASEQAANIHADPAPAAN